MTPFLVCDAAGRILRFGQLYDPDDVVKQIQIGETAYADLVADAALEYIVNGEVVERPACPIKASITGLMVILNGVPVNAPVRVGGDTHFEMPNDSGGPSVTLTFETAGRYTVDIDCFPAVDYHEVFTLT